MSRNAEPPRPPAAPGRSARAGQDLAGGFSSRTVGWLIGVASASLLAAFLFASFGGDLERKPDPQPTSWSVSVLGYRGLAELLPTLGLGVAAHQGSGASGAGPATPLVLAEPAIEVGAEAARGTPDDPALGRSGQWLVRLRREAEGASAPLVVVLPKWTGVPQPGHAEWISRLTEVPAERSQGVLAALGIGMRGSPGVRRAPGDALTCWAAQGEGLDDLRGGGLDIRLAPAQLLTLDGSLEPVVACSGGLLAGRLPRRSGPEILVIADPDLLNNQGLGRGDHARLVHALLAGHLRAQGIVFDESIHGYLASPGLGHEAFQFPLVVATAQALVLLGFVLWGGLRRFGKPVPAAAPLAAGKAVLIDNTARLLTRGGHVAESLQRYFRQTVRAAGARWFLPADLPEPELIARLRQIAAARSAAEGRAAGKLPDLAALESRIDGFARRRPRDTEGALVLARALHAWREEMARAG